MFRKLTKALAVGAALALALTGCTTEGEEPTDGEPANTAEEVSAEGPKNGESYVFGNIAYNMKDVWNKYSADAFEFATGHVDEPVEVITLDAENSLEKSVSLMEELIAKDVDGISVFPISPEQAATLGQMAADAGIPVTFENTLPDLEESEYVSVIAAEYDLIGEEAMNYIAETYPGANVLFVAGAKGGGVYETYQEGIDRAMAELGNEITIVDTVHGDWETELAMNVTADAINAGTEFDVVFANNEQMGKGVKNALDEAGIGDVPIVATGGGPDGLKMIEDGDITATMSAPVSLQGLTTFKNLYQFVVLGNTPEKFTPLPIIPVDASNIAEAVSWEPSDSAVEYIGGIQ
ncbi:sugar ABC transporter substrate-binding protein [Tessaracoccus rhinocerotis]|uniref:Sugar ABC transporter substrate-binding protein n=1 Tax=Tessaracoccus rhinocerotis TaxID=1689449 RepID=A0A553JZ00_9ACTN|nr:sugar ABC transporter substrate-binding protein [Tessaracoccus rhinocerotis]TRY17663.1 sugar ABC transporter substrate-binding protein [Tessaracoccus rhinocerotis]